MKQNLILGNIINVEKENSKCIVEIQNLENSYEIPIIYYKGYKAILDNGNNQIELNTEKSKNGLILVNLPKSKTNSYGKLTIWYNGTNIQKLSYIISILAIIITILLFSKNFNLTKKQENN
ncbi:MAG: hypothetical protein HFJ45_05480 [Clostridia bacterium]|nr:hypothetical protein [Clostridia bacterium]